MIVEAISSLVKRDNLDANTAMTVMDEIMNGEATDAQKSAYLTAMYMKGPTIEEITGSATSMRSHALAFPHNLEVMDVVGTGGDGAHSINISTISALVAATAGIKIAKHGNRAASSKCGTADVLESLGVKIALEPDDSLKVLQTTNFAFLFAQKYHGAMRHVGAIRKEIRIPTIFNILGPLSNPARNSLQLLGVYEERLVVPLAQVLSNLGVQRGMVVYGQDGLDEISISAPTTVCEFQQGEFYNYKLTPEQFGFPYARKEDLLGGTPEENADFARAILRGTLQGPKTNAVILNAGAAIHIGKKVSILQGIEEAKQILASASALTTLEKVIQETNQY